jgi:hypothetical protein
VKHLTSLLLLLLPLLLLLLPQSGEAEAMRKVKILSWTGLASFLFSVIKWLLSGLDYGCGFGSWPAFGFKAMKYTWYLDCQQNYIGAGGGGRRRAMLHTAQLPMHRPRSLWWWLRQWSLQG